ncbi:MAG: hypothetical protein GYB53_21770 [Rhodobacteraceae bacterium]|nr:hypothetical protein [Paracoccaceae bacterium]MBR9823075.1 hypothetical protein [Paracoccaceae bacterium]
MQSMHPTPINVPRPPLRPQDLGTIMNAVVALYGPRRVLMAALRALISPRARKRRQLHAAELSPHLRQDVGLGPAQTAPPYTEYLR